MERGPNGATDFMEPGRDGNTNRNPYHYHDYSAGQANEQGKVR